MPGLSHPPFDHSNNIRWAVQIKTLLTVHFSPVSCHFLPFSPILSNTPSLCSFLNVTDQVSHLYRKAGTISTYRLCACVAFASNWRHPYLSEPYYNFKRNECRKKVTTDLVSTRCDTGGLMVPPPDSWQDNFRRTQKPTTTIRRQTTSVLCPQPWVFSECQHEESRL
jgi:hypothetical protein